MLVSVSIDLGLKQYQSYTVLDIVGDSLLMN